MFSSDEELHSGSESDRSTISTDNEDQGPVIVPGAGLLNVAAGNQPQDWQELEINCINVNEGRLNDNVLGLESRSTRPYWHGN